MIVPGRYSTNQIRKALKKAATFPRVRVEQLKHVSLCSFSWRESIIINSSISLKGFSTIFLLSWNGNKLTQVAVGHECKQIKCLNLNDALHLQELFEVVYPSCECRSGGFSRNITTIYHASWHVSSALSEWFFVAERTVPTNDLTGFRTQK